MDAVQELAAHDELFPIRHRSKSAPLGSPRTSPTRVGRSGHSHSRGSRSRPGNTDGSSPQPAAQEEHDLELGPPPMPGASPGMLAAQVGNSENP